jgi:hypothetical protein
MDKTMSEQQEIQEIKIAINRLDQNDSHITMALNEISQTLRQLVTLQKDHEVLRIECFAKTRENARVIELAHKRIDKVEKDDDDREKTANSNRSWIIKTFAGLTFAALRTGIGFAK